MKIIKVRCASRKMRVKYLSKPNMLVITNLIFGVMRALRLYKATVKSEQSMASPRRLFLFYRWRTIWRLATKTFIWGGQNQCFSEAFTGP
jgi:hypothetical protein